MNIWAGQVLINSTLGIDVFHGGLSAARNRGIIFSEPNKLFANAWLLRTECRTMCPGVSRILDNDEEIFMGLRPLPPAPLMAKWLRLGA